MVAKKSEGVGPLSSVVAFAIATIPFLIGIAMTGWAVGQQNALKIVNGPANFWIGIVLVIAGVFSIYTFFSKN